MIRRVVAAVAGTPSYPDALYAYGARTDGSIRDGRWMAEVPLDRSVPPGTYLVTVVAHGSGPRCIEMGDVQATAPPSPCAGGTSTGRC